jgi:basic amino acid/polyamine antiporter, APA family
MSEPSPATRNTGSLLRILGVGFGLAVIIGNTIGAGILRTPGVVADHLPSPAWFIGVWVLGGLYALLGAFSISELAAMVPRSGGYYVFARRALGEYPGFAIGWTDWMAQCGTTAAVAIVIGEYAGDLIPALRGRISATAIAVTIGVALLQWRGIRWGSTTQNVTTAAKAIGFVALVVAIFALATPAAADAPPAKAMPTGALFFGALLFALQAVIYTYDGWYAVIYFGEELRDPGRQAPRSTFGGVFSLMGIYLLVALALLYALPLSQIAGQNLALATAARSVFGPTGDTVIRVLMIISMLAGINAYHLMASRIPFAMSKDGLIAGWLGRANPGGTPTSALLLSAVISVGFILLGSFRLGETSAFDRVLAITAFFFVVNYLVAYTATFALRRLEPQTPRPYRAWGYPWTTGIALAGSLLFLIAAAKDDTANSLYALAVLALSYPLYKLSRRTAIS